MREEQETPRRKREVVHDEDEMDFSQSLDISLDNYVCIMLPV